MDLAQDPSLNQGNVLLRGDFDRLAFVVEPGIRVTATVFQDGGCIWQRGISYLPADIDGQSIELQISKCGLCSSFELTS